MTIIGTYVRYKDRIVVITNENKGELSVMDYHNGDFSDCNIKEVSQLPINVLKMLSLIGFMSKFTIEELSFQISELFDGKDD
jgi:hypothetical protein